MSPPASIASIGAGERVTGPRRVLIACDKFKGALTAEQACDAIAAVLSRRRPEWVLDRAPLSDGGDGFCRILTLASGGTLETVSALGPRFDVMGSGEARAAEIGWVESRRLPAPARELLPATDVPGPLAIVEMASINGLSLVPPERRDVWRSSSYGTGELLRAAAAGGAQSILLGVGGSATSDLGLGALCALGLRFEDARGQAVQPPLPLWWERIVRVRGGVQALPPLRIACDVQSPALGLCVRGQQASVPNGDYPNYWGAEVGFVLVSSLTAAAPPAEALNTRGFAFRLQGALPALLRFRVGSVGEVALYSQYCQHVDMNTGVRIEIPLDALTYECWNGAGQAFPATSGAPLMAWQIPANESTNGKFDFCIEDIQSLP